MENKIEKQTIPSRVPSPDQDLYAIKRPLDDDELSSDEEEPLDVRKKKLKFDF